MINPNLKGTIYYGTDIKYIEDIDKNGMDKPRLRNEQYISVSISGYESEVQCNHPELEELARVFSNELQVAEYKDKKLSFKEGYVNSITCLHGFGPNPNFYYPSFNGLMKNNRTQNTIVAVISKEASGDLVYPDKENVFEYFSLALHGFIRVINPDWILGWIVHKERVAEIKDLMSSGVLKERDIWIVEEEFEKLNYDLVHKSKYGVFPQKIENYIEGLKSQNTDTQNTCYEHLKNIIFHITSNDINWNNNLLVLGQELVKWLEDNRQRLLWDETNWQYNLIND